MDQKQLQKNRNTVILFVVICIVVLFLLKARRAQTPITIQLGDGAAPNAAQSQGSAQSAPAPTQSEIQNQAADDAANEEKEAQLFTKNFGLYRRVLWESAYGVMLPLRIRWGLACHTVDRAMIKTDLERRHQESVLVSIEPLLAEDESYAPIMQHLSADSFLNEAHVMLTLPKTEELVQLGLFICSDAQGTGRCLGKDAFKGKEEKSTNRANDRVYYFTHVMLRRNMLYHLGSASSEAYVRLGNILQQTSSLSPALQKKMLEKTSRLQGEVKPLALKLSPPAVEVVMPIVPDSCGN